MEFKDFTAPKEVTLDDYNAALEKCLEKSELAQAREFVCSESLKDASKDKLSKTQISIIYSLMFWKMHKYSEAYLMAKTAAQYKTS